MRALAVGLVLLYHFWPWRVQGGFIGVDIFFVISGFLITTHLINHPPQRFGDLTRFWGRRVRRLLPAAFLVILVTLAGVLLFAPATQWMNNARSAITAAVYVENWNLAAQSVDYLASTSAPTALQHYWSLSVEEQFYLIWPILIGVLALIVRKHPDRFRLVTSIGLGTVVAVSFGWSIYYTAVNPSGAYFVTTTRMWELGAGGLLAVVYPAVHAKLSNRPPIQVSLITMGVVIIGASALLLNGTGFPGWIAALPIAGAILVIAAGPADYPISFDRFLKWRPVQLLGDISYSVYLWHWPIVVLLPKALGHEVSWLTKLAAITATLVFAWASKTFVEDRFRGPKPLGVPLRRTFIFLLVGMLTVTGTGAVVWLSTRAIATVPNIDASGDCIGARMLLDPACRNQDVHGQQLLMTPLQSSMDMSVAYNLGCRWGYRHPMYFPECVFGSTDEGAMQVGLFGNSHAIPFLEPLISIASNHDWSVRTYLSSSCIPSMRLRSVFHTNLQNQGCFEFTKHAIADMKQRGISIVVMSVRVPSFYDLTDSMSLLSQFADAGIRVLVIRDVPLHEGFVPDCIAANRNDLSACDSPRQDSLKPDPLYDAAQQSTSPLVSAVDLSSGVCDSMTCYGVIGGLAVYFDDQHLSRTFAMSLQPYLEESVLSALA